jgi:hypothetical protein
MWLFIVSAKVTVGSLASNICISCLYSPAHLPARTFTCLRWSPYIHLQCRRFSVLPFRECGVPEDSSTILCPTTAYDCRLARRCRSRADLLLRCPTIWSRSETLAPITQRRLRGAPLLLVQEGLVRQGSKINTVAEYGFLYLTVHRCILGDEPFCSL